MYSLKDRIWLSTHFFNRSLSLPVVPRMLPDPLCVPGSYVIDMEYMQLLSGISAISYIQTPDNSNYILQLVNCDNGESVFITEHNLSECIACSPGIVIIANPEEAEGLMLENPDIMANKKLVKIPEFMKNYPW